MNVWRGKGRLVLSGVSFRQFCKRGGSTFVADPFFVCQARGAGREARLFYFRDKSVWQKFLR